MSLMGTLAKMAIGYAAAKGVDKLSGGGGIQGLLGGGARVPASDPTAQAQAGMADSMGAGGNPMAGMMDSLGGAGNPMAGMMDKLKESGLDLSAMMGGAAGGAGNPMAAMMDKMKDSGFDLSAMMGGGAADTADKGGLLSSVGGGAAGGAGLAGILAALGGAAAMGGQSTSAAIDQFKMAETVPQAEETAALMLRAMIQAAKADGDIDEAERAKILETLGDDADRSDIEFVQAQLAAPIDVAGLASATPDAMKPQVYAASLMTIRVDTQAEAQYLDSLAKAMDINEPSVNMLHMQMGLQPLYG